MQPRIIYIMGVSGSGKTTIGKLLAEKIGLPFFDADDYHIAANKEKMKNGTPLTDDDRAEWLKTINQLAKEQVKLKGAIIACSALKERYRTVLSGGVDAVWVYLKGSYELICSRMQQRKHHYMPASLLKSQFEILELPKKAITINISKEPQDIIQEIVEGLKEQ